MSRKHARTERRRGFTLMELMVVVTIIGVLSGLAMPSIFTAVRDMRASSARADVVRILNFGRAAARGTGKAHLLEFDASADESRGRLAAYRSNGSSCANTAWPTILARSNNCTVFGTASLTDDDCVARTAFPGFFEAANVYAFQLTEATQNLLYLCYEPGGRSFWSNQAGAAGLQASPPAASNGAFIFTVTTQSGGVGGQVVGVPRQILQPFGSTARVRR